MLKRGSSRSRKARSGLAKSRLPSTRGSRGASGGGSGLSQEFASESLCFLLLAQGELQLYSIRKPNQVSGNLYTMPTMKHESMVVGAATIEFYCSGLPHDHPMTSAFWAG